VLQEVGWALPRPFLYLQYFYTIKKFPRHLILVFQTGAAISFKELLNYPHEADWTTFLTNYFSENMVAL
jgi:hypothetical protein